MPATPASVDFYRVYVLYEESYRPVMARMQTLSASEHVSFAQLADAELLDRPNCEMRDTLLQASDDAGSALHAAYRSNRVDWFLCLAGDGSGVVILPETAILDDPRLIARPLRDVSLPRTVCALRSRHQPSRQAAVGLVR